MSILSPSLGLFFWHAVIFCAAVLLLTKYGWQPILAFIEQREQLYQAALREEERAKQASESLEKRNQAVLQAAERKKERLVSEGMAVKQALLAEAAEEAAKAKSQMLRHAEEEILEERKRAKEELRQEVGKLVVSATERLLVSSLQGGAAQDALLSQILTEAEAAPVTL